MKIEVGPSEFGRMSNDLKDKLHKTSEVSEIGILWSSY